ncbi:MAG TPA: CNNM domain-containing protein, partial [Candidatus Obscuribacterales bacterium]
MIAPIVFVLATSDSLPITGREALLRLLSVLLLIAINAFFVTAEFSIVSVRRSRINQLVGAGDVQAKTVQDLQRSIDRLLSTTQLGITLSSLALGWIGESTMAVLMAAWLEQLPVPLALRQTLAHSLAVPVAFLLIAYLQIVLGELCPKSVALLYSEQLARFLGPPSLAIARFFNPFIWVLNQSTRWLLKLAGIQYTGQGWYNQVTPEELQLIIATSSESTGLEAEERELLNNVFEFG